MENKKISPTQLITIRELIVDVQKQPYSRTQYRRAYKLLTNLNEKATKKFLFQNGKIESSPFLFSLLGLKEAGLECFGATTLFEENEDLKEHIKELEAELAELRDLE